MSKIIAKIHSYIMSKEGATAIEYGLIAGGISLAIVAAVFAFGDDLEDMFNTIGNAMDTAASEVEADGTAK